jgi:hypothetical protein
MFQDKKIVNDPLAKIKNPKQPPIEGGCFG